MNRTCMCIACDVKSSRSMEQDFVSCLVEAINELNDTFKEELIVPMDIRNGDELMGVVGTFKTGYTVAMHLRDLLSANGIHLYIGLGLGQLDTTDSSIHTMNGSAVISALEARDRYLKTKHPDVRNWQIDDEGTSIFFYSDAYPYKALNAIYHAMEDKIANRSEKQKEIVKLVKEHPSLTYEKLGKKMGYRSPKSTVSYLLTRAHFHSVNALEEALYDLLEQLQQSFKKEGA